ncbi:MAG TPA: TldD/PmbA family protein [Bacilli bacterium]|nr:TldD/PmbA family protein [Bacilli bacterium]
MELKAFQQQLFTRGKALGFTDMEVYYQAARDTVVRAFQGEVDSYTITEKAGLSFRGVWQGKMGTAFTEQIEEQAIDDLLRQAKENAEILENVDPEELFAGSPSYREVNQHSERLLHLSSEQLIETAIRLERVALQADPRIDLVNYCQVARSEGETFISNTKGLDCHHKSARLLGYVSAVAKEAEQVSSGMEFGMTFVDLDALNAEEVARQAASEALAKLNGDTIESDDYPVILRNHAAASLLKAFTSIFSGEAAEKGLSLLQDRIGEQVVGANITILDDPLLPEGPGSMPFDAEGVATAQRSLIQDGQLLTFLHNNKTAKKAGVATTGNAVKASYRAAATIAPHNLIIAPGEQSLDELIAGTERGLLLVEFQGIHAGTNSVSGDFSLSCLGYLIEQGKVVRPVNQITASGNILDLLKQVDALGDDLRFNGFGSGACGSPSLKVKSLSISGK